MSNNTQLLGFIQADNRGRVLLTRFRPGSAGTDFRVSLRQDGAIVLEVAE